MSNGIDTSAFQSRARQVGAEAQRERDRIAREAQQARDQISRQQSDLEAQAEAIKAQARQAERIEQRKRDLPITRPRELGTKQTIADIESQRVSAHAQAGQIKSDITKQETEASIAVNDWETQNLADIARARREYLREARETQAEAAKITKQFEADNIKLKTGEYVSKSDYKVIPDSAGKLYIMQHGVDAFNTWAKDKYKEVTQTPEQQFRSLQGKGDIPKEAIYKGYNKKSGQISYVVPKEETPIEMFAEMQASGDIPKGAIFDGYDEKSSQISYHLPPEKQFEAMKASGDIPKEAVYEGYDKETGAIKYTVARVPFTERPMTGQLKLGSIYIPAPTFVEQAVNYLGEVGYQMRGTLPEGVTAKSLAGLKYNAIQGAKIFIPGVWAMDWQEMSTTQKIVNTAIDAAFIASFFIGGETLASLRPSVRATAKSAAQSGKAWGAVEKTLATLEKTPIESTKYAAVASETQKAIQASLKADKVFATKLVTLSKVTLGQLAKLEKLSGLKGLKTAIVDIGNAQRELSKAWKPIKQLKFGGNKYIKQMAKVQQAQAKLSKAMESFQSKLEPRFKLTPPPAEFKGFSVESKEIYKLTTTDPIISTLGGGARGKPVLAVLERPKVKLEKGYQISLIPQYGEPKPTVKAKVGAPKVTTKPSVFPGLQTVRTTKGATVVKEGYNPAYRERIYDRPDVREREGVYVEVVGSPLEGTKLVIVGKTQPTTGLEALTKAMIADVTKEAIRAANEAAAKDMTKGQAKEFIRSKVEAKVRAITQTKVKTQVKTLTRTITQLATELSLRLKTKFRIRPDITLPNGATRPMTKKELAGAVAWKQGFIYKMIYPPYGKWNIENRLRPFPGVRTVTGVRSAYETIVRIGGKLPPTIKRDMGIMDITVTTIAGKKPELRFRRDILQQTTFTRGKAIKRSKRAVRHYAPMPMITSVR